MTRLKINNLTITRGARTLIKDFSYSFKENRIYALVGDNGAGKTTFLKTIAGLLPTKAGRIFISGKDLAQLAPKDRAAHLSFLLQHSPEQQYCTALSRISHGLMPSYGFNLNLDEGHVKAIETVARNLNILHLLHRPLCHLSGGEQRLVHLAKCFINPHNQILLLDEPSVFLDFTQQRYLGNCLKSFKDKGQLIIFSSHDAGFIEQFASDIIKISQAQLLVFPHEKVSSFNFLDNNVSMAALTSSP